MDDDGFAQRHIDEFVRVAGVLQGHVHPKRTGDFHVFPDEDAIITVHGRNVRHGLLNGPCIGPTTLFGVSPSTFTNIQWCIDTGWGLLSGIPHQVVAVRVGIVQGCNAFRDRFRFGPRHFKQFISRGFNALKFFCFHRFEQAFFHAHVNQQRTVRWDGVFGLPIGQQIPVNIAGWCTARIAQIEVVMVVSVSATTHGFNVNEGWTAPRHGKFSGHGG